MVKRQHESWRHLTDHLGRPSVVIPVGSSYDYDGCFGNTEEVMTITQQVTAENTSLTVDQIKAARAETEAQHKPFSTVEFIESELIKTGEGKTWLEDIKPSIIERSKEAHHQRRLLAVGARAVFGVARRYGMYEFVMTHGAVAPPGGDRQKWSAIEWQSGVKTRITPEIRDMPVFVSLEYAKGEVFDSWFVQEMNAFLLPPHMWIAPKTPTYLRSIVHGDDKKTTMRGWPLGKPVYAMHILPISRRETREVQLKGELPEGARTARGMFEAARQLEEMRYDELAQFYRIDK